MMWIAEPRGRYGRLGQIGGYLATMGALFAFDRAVLHEGLNAPTWVSVVFMGSFAILGILVEFTVLGDSTEEELERENPTSSAVKYHSIER